MITSIVFVALFALFLAVGMAVKDFQVSAAGDSAPVSIRRQLTPFDSELPSNFVQRFHSRFDRVVLESGTGISPIATVLLMLLTAALIGGLIFMIENDPVPGLLAALVGLLVPLVILAFMRRRRLNQIAEQLPDVLALMARAVHAGETMEQAVALAGADTPAPLGPEFTMCARQIGLGVSVSRAMESLGKRVAVSDISVLSTILSVHRQTGGNLASTLEHLAGVVRDRASHRRQIRAATSAGRLSAQFIGITGPLLFIILYFFNRDHLAPLLEMPMGNMLLLAAAILETVGLVWLMQMLRGQNQ
jgi:tight adherence protein B